MRFDELNWVEFLKKNVKKSKAVTVGIGDDCAVIKNKSSFILLSSDLFIEDIHFKLKTSSFKVIGQRAVARAISDIAACCGRPKFIVISLGLPFYVNKKDLKEITKGITVACKNEKVFLVGGDTSHSEKLFLDVMVLGEVKKPILRSGACEGDYIFLSGKLGKLAFNKPFNPKIKEALYLAKNFKISSMIDLTDGFILDLYRILKASKKGALIEKDKIPVTRGESDYIRGEDYELIFTVSKNEPKISFLKNKFYCLGRIKSKAFGFVMLNKGKKEKIKPKGYLHF